MLLKSSFIEKLALKKTEQMSFNLLKNKYLNLLFMKNKPNGIKTLCLLVFAVLTFNLSLNAQDKIPDNPEWKLIKTVKKGEGWQIYVSKIPNSKLKLFKIVGNIKCSPKEAQTAYFNMITDPNLRITKKGKSLGWVKVLEQTDNSMVVYDYMTGNSVAKDRDLVAKYTLFENSAENTMGIKWKQVDWEGYEPTDSIIRMPVATGCWSFKGIDSENSTASGVYLFHPGGNPPAWLINIVVKKSSPIELNHLRNSVKNQITSE